MQDPPGDPREVADSGEPLSVIGMGAFILTGAGFLTAVLWFDLMFDVQIRRPRVPDEQVLASIAAYYRRVTTTARPMNALVAIVMVLTLAALIAQLVRAEAPVWVSAGSLV